MRGEYEKYLKGLVKKAKGVLAFKFKNSLKFTEMLIKKKESYNYNGRNSLIFSALLQGLEPWTL